MHKKARRTFTLEAEIDSWYNEHKDINASQICEEALRAAMKREEKLEADLSQLPVDDALKVDLDRSLKKRDWFRVQRIRGIMEKRLKKEPEVQGEKG